MAVNVNATKIANLFDPQVIGARIENELYPRIRFAPLASIDYSLQGGAGSTLTLPYYNKLSSGASVVPEGTDVPIVKLTEATKTVQVSKIGIGVELTDESVLYSYGDPVGEAVSQMASAIADKVDDDFLTVLSTDTTLTYTMDSSMDFAENIADALVKFGDKVDEGGVLIVDADGYAKLRKSKNWVPNTEIGGNILINGTVGRVLGFDVVVASKITTDYYIVKAGALGMVSKRETAVETDRDIVAKSTVITADKHYAVWLKDATKAIKVTK